MSCFGGTESAALVLTGVLLALKAYGLNFPVPLVAGPHPLVSEVNKKGFCWLRDALSQTMNEDWQVRSDYCFTDTVPSAYSL